MRREIIPYNPALKELAKKLRQNLTFSEVKLWKELRNGQVMGYDFDRQKPMGNYIVDFYCKDLKLALEVDGITHSDERIAVKDKTRQSELEVLGVSFLRFDALVVINKVESVVREIERWMTAYEVRNGVSEYVERRRLQRMQPDPPLPLPGGDEQSQVHF
jgi:very-short-patch-repair endonuclease